MLAMPLDANPYGDIFGGWIMAQVDIAGSIPAVQLSQGRVATIAVNHLVFKAPVQIGDLLSFFAQVTRHGNTSITVAVQVYAERNPSAPVVVKVCDAELTYVAVDTQGKKRPIPGVTH